MKTGLIVAVLIVVGLGGAILYGVQDAACTAKHGVLVLNVFRTPVCIEQGQHQ